MNFHLVSVYMRAGVLAHVQSTNGENWGGDITETDALGAPVPLTRIDVKLEPSADEIANGVRERPAPRSASALFGKELEVVAGKVRYRAGQGGGGAIVDR